MKRGAFALRYAMLFVGMIMGTIWVTPGTVSAQVTTATFYGIATDPSGAIVPGATATMAHQGTGAVTTKVSDAAGEFVFDFLRVGTYTLRIQAEGFKISESSGIMLTAGQSTRSTFPLELGAVSETVLVEGAAPLVNTVSAEQSASVNRLEISALPLARRDFTALMSINTGVTTSGGAVRLNGLGRSGTGYTVDGTDATSDGEGRSVTSRGNFHYISLVSIDAIEEVQTVKGVIPAEYAGVIAGNVNIITRSGTNEWHGGVFENFQADELSARNPFSTSKDNVPATFNQFGGHVGGPIQKDRIFFFGTYEGYRESAFQLVTATVPTQKLRNEMITAVPDYKPTLDRLPLPNEAHAADADTGFFSGESRRISRDNHLTVKGDIRLFNASNLALTYTRGRPYRVSPRAQIDNDQVLTSKQERFTASYVTGGAAWSSETRFGYNLNNVDRTDPIFEEIVGNSEENVFGRRFPGMMTNLGFSTPLGELYSTSGPIWSLEHKYARHIGQHSLKMGARYSDTRVRRTNPETPIFNYQGKADLLANIPSQLTFTFGNGIYNSSNAELGFFVQDDWRIKRNLVINLGLRYDYYTKFTASSAIEGETYGFYNLDGLLDSNFNFGPQRPADDPYENDGWVNLGPRVGFSYTPGGSGKTVLRGGFGVMFSPHISGMLRQAVGQADVPYRSRFGKIESAAAKLTFPSYNDDAVRVVKAAGLLPVFSVFNPNLQNPYSMSLYFGIQRALSEDLMLETAFVGNRGVKFPLHRIFNQPDRLTGIRPNLQLTEGFYVDNSQTSIYGSWQSSLRKRLSHNLTANAHYTWGKALSTESGDIGAYNQNSIDVRVQDFFDLSNEWGPSDGDVTHYFVSDWVYELPRMAGMSNSFLRQALGGWQVTGIYRASTGPVFLMTQGEPRETSRPDYIGGDPIFPESSYEQDLQYLNKDAFRTVAVSPVSGRTIRPGNMGKNALRGPGLWNIDVSLGKEFAITEEIRFIFRADVFNFLNHLNPSGFSTDVTNSRFGKFTSGLGSRNVQLNARLTW